MMEKIALLIVVMSAVILFWQIHLYPIRFGIYEGLYAGRLDHIRNSHGLVALP